MFRKINKQPLLLWVVVSVGCVVGIIMGINSLGTAEIDMFTPLIEASLISGKNDFSVFNHWLKEGKFLFFIWIMAFIPVASLFTPLFLLYKGISFGFTAFLLMNGLGLSGASVIIFILLPEAIWIFFVYIQMIQRGLMFSDSRKQKRIQKPQMKGYTLILLLGVLGLGLSSILMNIFIPFFL